MKNYESNFNNIMEVLLSNSDFLTMDFIARNTGLSKRSVQNYLTDIDEWLMRNSLLHTKVVRKQGQGVKIDADYMDRLKTEKLLSGKSMSIDSDDNKRRLEIIKRLLIYEEDINIKSLSELFFISRGTVISDLEWVKGWLLSYKIELYKTQNKGIVTRGSEISYRNAIAGYFDSFESIEPTESVVLGKHGRVPEKSYKNLIKIYHKDNVEKVRSVIEEAEKKFNFFLTEDYYTSMLTHIVISISRLISGNTVPQEFSPPIDEKFPDFIIETTKYIAKRLEFIFDIKVPEMEKTYICIHLVGFNALPEEHSDNAEISKEVKQLALELIKSVDQQLGTKFISDKILFFGLCMHLKSEIFRLQKDIYYKKSSGFQMPDSNMDIYYAVGTARNLYSEICGVRADEEEIFNAACYFLLSLRRKPLNPKALLICNRGIIERIELMNSIGDEFPAIDIADCCTTFQLKLLSLDEYDFIISYETVDIDSVPFVVLSEENSGDYSGVIRDFLDNTIL